MYVLEGRLTCTFERRIYVCVGREVVIYIHKVFYENGSRFTPSVLGIYFVEFDLAGLWQHLSKVSGYGNGLMMTNYIEMCHHNTVQSNYIK